MLIFLSWSSSVRPSSEVATKKLHSSVRQIELGLTEEDQLRKINIQYPRERATDIIHYQSPSVSYNL